MATSTPRRAATAKRKTTPRKPATRRAPAPAVQPVNGATNGEAVRPPERYEMRETQTGVELIPPHPYGEKPVQVFTPSDGEPIVVPHISTVDVNELFLWEMERAGLDLMHQSWRWLDRAGIPDEIQRRIIGLPPMDKRRFWEQWFEGFVPPPTGEPPGES
jgi:hypothetical protein